MKTILICGCLVAATFFGSSLLKGKENVAKAKVAAIDSNMLGMWRDPDDTDKKNFVFVQSLYDMVDIYKKAARKVITDTTLYNKRRKELSNFSDEEARKLINDTSDIEKIVKKYQGKEDKVCLTTYFNYGGHNPLYQQWDTYNIQIGAAKYFIVKRSPVLSKIIEADSKHMVLALAKVNGMFSDTEPEDIAAILQKNEARIKYYDTVTLYKFNSYHYSLNTASEMVSGRK